MQILKTIKAPSDLEQLRQAIIAKRDPDTQVVGVCCTTGCRAGGAVNIVDSFKKELAKNDLEKMLVEISQKNTRLRV